MSEQETIFVDGLIFTRPHEKSPDFVKGGIAIKVDELIAFLQKHKKADGWVNADLLKSKQGKLYFKLNTWEPSKKDDAPDNQDPTDPDNIPF